MLLRIFPGSMSQGENQSAKGKQDDEDNGEHKENGIPRRQTGLMTGRPHAGGAGEEIGKNGVQCVHKLFFLNDDVTRLPNEERKIEKKCEAENATDPPGCGENCRFLGTKPTQQYPSRITQQKQGHENDEEDMEEFDRHNTNN